MDAVPEEREQAKKNYYELIQTSGFPNKPDGSKMIYRAAVKTGVIFEAAKNKKRAKEFVSFFLQDEVLTPYVEGSLGRWYPVTKAAAERPFWKADRHRQAVYNQFHAGTVTFAGRDITGLPAEQLAALGFARTFRYEKRREEWSLDECVIALDETPIGAFAEIEGDPAAIRRALQHLALDPADSLPYSYSELYARRRREDPTLPPDMLLDPPV